MVTAYSFSARKCFVDDDLPDRDWLPLILRCRELGERVSRPIIDILQGVAMHAGMSGEENDAFANLVHRRVRSGNALILIDGLDEISNEQDRTRFATHLRTFIAVFPQATVVVTSREAGFRQVAGVISGACEQARLAPLDAQDAINLCERWHVEVVGDKPKVRAEAIELGRTLWRNTQIRTLAENPLLLTTLLVVKRNLGELPKSRNALYQEAIKVLVRTWNIEGYEPLHEEETLPQLSYVASAMTMDGIQQVARTRLLELLRQARRELDSELQFVSISPERFIERIEYRSSLLMLVGHDNVDGRLEQIYEFRHLTFQEYLTASAFVMEQYPGRNDNRSLAEALAPYFLQQQWREVIPLAIVLAGRKAEELLRKLTEASSQIEPESESDHVAISNLLLRCVRDEPQIPPATLREALKEVASRHTSLGSNYQDGIVEILNGKFGALFRDTAEQAFLGGGPKFERFVESLSLIAVVQFSAEFEAFEAFELTEACAKRLCEMFAGSRLSRIYAALVCMQLAFEAYEFPPGGHQTTAMILANRDRRTLFRSLFEPLIGLVSTEDRPSTLVASWALAWFGEHRNVVTLNSKEQVLPLWRAWRSLGLETEAARFPAWALWGAAPLARRA